MHRGSLNRDDPIARAFQRKEDEEYREYRRKYGLTFVTIEPDSDAVHTPRRVTFSDETEQFFDSEQPEESVEDIVLHSLMPEPRFIPSVDELDDDTLLAAAE